jgi:hypothetical protein
MKEYVPEFPPSIPIDSHAEGRRAYHRGENYWNAPKEGKEYWQQGWLSAKEFDNR